MKAPSKDNIAYGNFQKKTTEVAKDIDNHERIKDSYKYIQRLDGKLLNAQDKQVFDLLLQLTKSGPVAIDYSWLEEKLFKSQKTIQRTLRNLSQFYVCKFHHVLMIEGRKVFNKIMITRSAILDKTLADAVEELRENKNKKGIEKYVKNVRRCGQKCPEVWTKMSSTYIEERIQENDITTSACVEYRENSTSEKIIEINSFKEDKILNKRDNSEIKRIVLSKSHKEPPRTPEEERKYLNKHRFIKRESEGPLDISSVLGKAFKYTPAIAETVKEIITSKTETDHMKPTDAIGLDEKFNQFKTALKESLEISIAEEIERYCSFNFTPKDNKLIIALQKGLELSEQTKTTIKAVVKQIYGEEAGIIAGYKKPNYWSIIRNNIIEKIGTNNYKNWLEKLEVIEDYTNKKVTLKATKFQLNEIKSRFGYDLTNCAKNSGAEIFEILSDSTNESIIIYGNENEEQKILGASKDAHILWNKFKLAVISYFPQGKGDYVIQTWFNDLIIGKESNFKHLILVGVERIVDHIHTDYAMVMEHVAETIDVIIELRYFDNAKLPIIYSNKK